MKKSLLFTAIVVLLANLPIPASSQGWNIDSVGTCYNLWGELRCAEISGDYAYLGSYFTGLRVVDISDSSNIHEVGYCLTPETVISIAISGDYAYLVDQHLRIADISDPTNPVLIGTYDPAVTFYHVAIYGSYAYATTLDSTTGHHEFRIMDISSPTNPQETGVLNLPASATCIILVDHYAYIGVYPNSMFVIDVSDPHSPYEVTQRGVPIIWDIAASNNVVCAMSLNYDLYVFDCSDPGNPQQVGFYNGTGGAASIAASGVYFCIAAEHATEIIDVSDPANPQQVGSIMAHDIPYDISVLNNTAYVLEVAGFYRAIDISNPTDPIEISYISNWGEITDIAVSGDYAVTTLRYSEDALRVLDVSNPSHPVEVGRCPIPNQEARVQISGNYAYVAHWAGYEAGQEVNGGVRVVNIFDPTNPYRVGFFDSERGQFEDFVIQNDLLYIINISELIILDISDPAQPTELCSYDPGGGHNMGIAGNYLFITRGSDMHIIDVSDPYNPNIVGNYDVAASPGDVFVSGQYAYLGSSVGLQVLDISDPIHPQLMGTCAEAQRGRKVVMSGDHVFILDNSSRLVAIDVSDPTNPTISGYHENQHFPQGFDVSDQYAYVGHGTLMSIYDCAAALSVPESRHNQIPESIILYPAYPNPFNPTTKLSFALPVRSRLTLNVYDVTGRHVGTLVNGWQDAGAHQVVFDGSGLSSGIYFCQLKTDQSTAMTKIVLLK
jgi:hypothetical protein